MSNREHQYAVEDIAVAYAPVPPELLLARPKLTDTELRVWCVFAMHRSFQTAKTHIGASTVGEILGVDRTTVGRAIKGLIDKGHLADLGRERDSDTGRMKPREFAVLVNGKRLKLGIVQERTEPDSHDADTPHGGDNEPESEGDVHDANHDAGHEASHDASHDAELHTPPNEYAPALNEGERRGNEGEQEEGGAPEQPIPDDTTSQCLLLLKNTKGVAKDYGELAVLLAQLRSDFPDVDAVETCKEYQLYHDNPPKKTQNHALKLRRFFKTAANSIGGARGQRPASQSNGYSERKPASKPESVSDEEVGIQPTPENERMSDEEYERQMQELGL